MNTDILMNDDEILNDDIPDESYSENMEDVEEMIEQFIEEPFIHAGLVDDDDDDGRDDAELRAETGVRFDQDVLNLGKRLSFGNNRRYSLHEIQ